MRRTLLNPKIDFVFKKIFGSQEHPEILISLNVKLGVYFRTAYNYVWRKDT